MWQPPPFFDKLYLIIPIFDKKDFENFVILSMVVIFTLRIASRAIEYSLTYEILFFSLLGRRN